MTISSETSIAYGFGILGNIVSFLVYLAPLPTFYRIWKKKSTQGFQSIPYAVSLFSAMLYLYYAFLKRHAIILISINTTGCVIEITYLTIYLLYATKELKVFTSKLILLFNVSSLGLIITSTYFLTQGHQRVELVGWICAIFSLCCFVAPLGIMRQVMRTKSVEFMPFSLSFFLTVSATVWFFYGFLISDYYVAAPNVLGFIFGIMQMILYMVYKNRTQPIQPTTDAPVHNKITIESDLTVQESKNSSDIEVVVVEAAGDGAV